MNKFPHRAALLLCGIAACLALTVPSPTMLPLPVEQHPAQATVKIVLADGGTGSGIPVRITPEGFTIVLTAKHVVENVLPEVVSVIAGETSTPVSRIERHPVLDLAALWVQVQLPAIGIDYDPIAFGERLQGAGFLFGDSLTLAEGLVSIPGHVSIDILPGCSGGPVIRNGRLVGVLVQCIVAGSPFGRIPIGAQAIFVEISAAREWLSDILR